MKKLLSIILAAAMLLSAAVLTVGATDDKLGFGTYAPLTPQVSGDDYEKVLSADQIDDQGIYYSLNNDLGTATVGLNTYSDSASAGALTTDSIVIPETVVLGDKTYAVALVGRNAFDGTAVREVVIGGATIIGEFAFAGCTKLETVYAAEAATIKGFAFWGCTALNQVNIIGADSIGGGAFWNCSNLTFVTLGASTIMEKAFADSGISDVVFTATTAPAVGADAFPAEASGYIPTGATGYDALPIFCTDMGTVVAVETAYAKAGETVEIAIAFLTSTGAVEGDKFSFDLILDEGLSVEGALTGSTNMTCSTELDVVSDTKVSGTLAGDFPGTPVVILQVKVADNATGSMMVDVLAEGSATYITGAVIVCDHADTKTVTVKAASCNEAGTENTVCTACGEVISSAEVDAKGHSYTDFVIAPTCTEGGYTRHICDCCSDAYTDAEVEALGHTWDEGNVKVEASESKEGLVTYTCTTCGTTKDVKLPKISYGDANGDGKINLGDASITLKYIAKWELAEGTFNATNANVNGDAKINLGDVSLLLKYIAKWDVDLGPKK